MSAYPDISISVWSVIVTYIMQDFLKSLYREGDGFQTVVIANFSYIGIDAFSFCRNCFLCKWRTPGDWNDYYKYESHMVVANGCHCVGIHSDLAARIP